MGSEDLTASRDAFVMTVGAMGGRVTSESVVQDGGGGSAPYAPDNTDGPVSAGDATVSEYPWYPSAPGIWLSVEVPARRHDEAMQAAQRAGEVVRLEQSTYDAGGEVADVEARIAALKASLSRLRALMDRATSVSDVVALEEAMSTRQAELDGLRARQRELADSTSMSRISLTLMSPQDARTSVAPGPAGTWWDSLRAAIGQSVLILSPVLVAGAVVWWSRRRRRSGHGVGSSGPVSRTP